MIEHIVYVPVGVYFLPWITDKKTVKYFKNWLYNYDHDKINKNRKKIRVEYNISFKYDQLIKLAKLNAKNYELFYVVVNEENKKIEWRRIEENYFYDWFIKLTNYK